MSLSKQQVAEMLDANQDAKIMRLTDELAAEREKVRGLTQDLGLVRLALEQKIAQLELADECLATAQLDNQRLREFLKRYRYETPLGYQPHMIAQAVDEILSTTQVVNI